MASTQIYAAPSSGRFLAQTGRQGSARGIIPSMGLLADPPAPRYQSKPPPLMAVGATKTESWEFLHCTLFIVYGDRAASNEDSTQLLLGMANLDPEGRRTWERYRGPPPAGIRSAADRSSRSAVCPD